MGIKIEVPVSGPVKEKMAEAVRASFYERGCEPKAIIISETLYDIMFRQFKETLHNMHIDANMEGDPTYCGIPIKIFKYDTIVVI